MKKLFVLFVLFSFFSLNKVHADFLIGIGYSLQKLPSNESSISLVAPDGETANGIYIYTGSNKPNKFSFGLSASGYSLKKWVSDSSGRVESKWTVPHYSGYLTYRVLLGQDKNSNPSLAIRGGVSVVPVKYSANFNSSSLGSNSETEIGPYFGADFLFPIQNTPFNIFVVAEKTFCKYKDEVNVGSFSICGGIAYVFKSK